MRLMRCSPRVQGPACRRCGPLTLTLFVQHALEHWNAGTRVWQLTAALRFGGHEWLWRGMWIQTCVWPTLPQALPPEGVRNVISPRDPVSLSCAFTLNAPQQVSEKGALCLALCFRTNTHLECSTVWGNAWEAAGRVSKSPPGCTHAVPSGRTQRTETFSCPFVTGGVGCLGALPCPMTW